MCMELTKGKRFKPVEIGKVDGVPTVVETVEEGITCYGGAPMLAKVEKKVGLVKRFSELIHDERQPDRVKHTAFDILMQRTCQIATGNADGNDCDWLRFDPGILMALDRDPATGKPGSSQETTSKVESRAITQANVKWARELFVDHFIFMQKKRPKKIELDPDGSMIKTYGAQEGAVYRGGDRYGCQMYFPLKIFCGKWLVATILRRGDQAESRTILDALKMVIGKLRAKWPSLRVKVRMDAAFGSPELYDWLRKERVTYEIAMSSNSVLDSYAKAFKEQCEAEFRKLHGEPRFIGKGGKKKAQEEHARIRGIEDPDERMAEEKKQRHRRTRVVGEFCYKPEKWKNWERVICRVDFTDRGFDIHYVVVSRQYGVPQRIYEEDYCLRGKAEQSIGRLKQTGLRLSAQQFYTNQFRSILYGISYMIMMHLREFAAEKLRKADVNTLRKVLMLMPMVVCRTKTKIRLLVSEKHAHCREFLAAWRQLSAA